MGQFKEFYEASEVVDSLSNVLCELGDETDFVDRFGGGLGDIAKGVAKGVGQGVASPFLGLWQAARRMRHGSNNLEKIDADRAFKKSKEDLLRWLMTMEPDVRSQEISKLIQSLESIKTINNADPQARDNWLKKLLMHGTYRGFPKPSYRKLAGM